MGLAYPGQVLDVYSRSSILDLLNHNEEVISFDPGDSTGVAVISLHHTYLATYGYYPLLDFLKTSYPSSVYVAERFVTAPNPFARNQIAGKVCGALDYHTNIHHKAVVYQSPADMKTMLPDLKALRRGGWSWSTDHERDALRHAILYLVTR